MNVKEGFIALASVLTISAVLLSIALGLSTRSIGETVVSASVNASLNSRILSKSCFEYAVMNLQQTLDYSGEEELEFSSGECAVLEIEGNGNNDRVVKIQSTSSKHVHRLKATISQISPNMVITSIEQVSAF